eukprot:TCALIF_13730-PA protein Name:"Protein of unknown function" AED:0.59 eAED:0.75 QI:0/0/0/0.66/1/1/3/0/91
MKADKECIRQGYRDDVNTYLVLTGKKSLGMAFHLGNFIGPTMAGIFVNAIGFPQASQISIFVFLLMAFLDCMQCYYQVKKTNSQYEYENIS